MPTKAQIEKWIPGAVADFQSVMPPIDTPYPSTYVADSCNFDSIRNRLVKETNCLLPEGHGIEFGEYIRGDRGRAILLNQTLLENGQHMDFCNCYWHELGHFYAIATQDPDLVHYSDPGLVDESQNFIFTHDGPILGLSDERIIQQGYWFWQEFVAQAIANIVQHEIYPIDQTIRYPDNRYFVIDTLDEMLSDSIYINTFSIDEYVLAHYYAFYLLDDRARDYAQAALNNELVTYTADDDIVPISEDPTRISIVEPEEFQEPLWRMKALVEKQLQNERFWLISKEALFGFGSCIADMMLIKFKLIASGEI